MRCVVVDKDKVLLIRVGDMRADVDEFVKPWNRANSGEEVQPAYSLTFESMGGWMAVLTPKRWELLQVLKSLGPQSIYALAKALERDYKNVHGDVRALEELGLIARAAHDRVEVPWDEIEAHMRLAA
jgi:predicted transcriptional regulator